MSAWKNRVIGTADVDPNKIELHPLNFRLHPAHQRAALKGSLDTLGWINTVLVNKTTGHVIDGHARVKMARDAGDTTVPVTYIELTEAEEAQALLSLDPIAAMAETDKHNMAELMAMVQSTDQNVIDHIQRLSELEEMPQPPSVEDVEPKIERADELQEKWQCATGQIWRMGDHRIICGDSTDKSTVEALMDGGKAQIVFTDPPYGVSIGKKAALLNKNSGGGGMVETGIEDDDLSPDELKERLLPAFVLMRTVVMDEDCTVFMTAPQGGELGMMMMMMMKEAGLPIRHVLMWKKNSPTFSMGRLDYDYAHEPILLTWQKKHKRPMLGQHRTSVWEIDRPSKSKEHPTMKPVELVENALLNNSDRGDICFDAYSGSGTTILACERQGRRARVIEISPRYVAVALERWSEATGQQPELIQQEHEHQQ